MCDMMSNVECKVMSDMECLKCKVTDLGRRVICCTIALMICTFTTGIFISTIMVTIFWNFAKF